MKYWTSVLAIVILALGSWSCKKEESPSQYDANIDAPPTIAQVPADSGILKDQRKISAAVSIEGISAAPTTPNKAPGTSGTKPVTPESAPATPPAAGTSKKPPDKTIEEITTVIVKMDQAIMAKPNEIPTQYMTAECAAALTPIAAASTKSTADMAKLKDLIKSKGIQVSPSMEKTLKAAKLTDGLSNPDMSKMTWEETPEGVLATPQGKDGQSNLYVSTPNGWKYEISKAMKPMLPIMLEFMTAQDKLAVTLTAGLTNGSITKANFEAKASQSAKEIVGPAAVKRTQFMTQNAPKSGGGGN